MSEHDDKLLAKVSGDEDSEEEEDTVMGEVDVDNGAGITEWQNCGYSKAGIDSRVGIY